MANSLNSGRKLTEDSVRSRIIGALRAFSLNETSVSQGIPNAQRRLNNQISHGKTLTLDTILLILERMPEVKAEWLLRGDGAMTAEHEAKSLHQENTFGNNIGSYVADDSRFGVQTTDDSITILREQLAEKDRQIRALLNILAK